jgi:hypothetical protein
MDTGGLKCYVLMLSEYFPAVHPKKGKETHFMAKILADEKTHTIRANYDLWAKRVEEINKGKAYLSIRQWTGKPYRSKQNEIFQLYKLGIEHISMKLKGKESYLIENQDPPYFLFEIAKKDGLEYHDFLQWFFPGFKSGKFEGAILHFTDFRYIKSI